MFVFDVDILNDFFMVFMFEIDVDIWWFVVFFRNELFK